MKKRIEQFIHSKVSKRIASALTAVVMLVSILPVGEVKDEIGELDFGFMKASAEDILFPHDATTKEVTIQFNQLVDYSVDCENHRDYHKDDNLIISADGQTAYFASGFKGLGSTDNSYPFEGSVRITASAAGDKVLNLDAPLFNYVYDDVVIWNEYGANNGLNIARTYRPDSLTGENAISKKTPLLANHVLHRNGGATWNVNVTTPSYGSFTTLQSFGGIIGTMEYDSEHDAGASLTVNVYMNTVEGDANAIDAIGEGNMGLACGTMQDKTTLNFSLSTNRGIGEISTASGHAGSLVGEMKSGSAFTYTGDNPQTVTANSKLIKTGSGYAGGLVGKNVGGTVTLANYTESPYPLGQTIEGTSGAGGVYGYYEPTGTDDVTLSTSNYYVSCVVGNNTFNCQVNGGGNTGGLIGELVCTNNVTINGTQTVSTSHASGNAATYGGLIGKYTNDASHTLKIENLSITTSGTASYYGGCVGTIDSTATSYALFDALTITSNSVGGLTYGGLVGSADNAFIDVNSDTAKTTTVTASGFKGGGLIGSLDHGVLRMDGTINLTGATPTAPTKSDSVDETDYVGRIVGWRDDALVFTKSSCNLTKSSAAVDDIGSWGQVIRFGADVTEDVAAVGETAAYKKAVEKLNGVEVLSVNESTHQVTIAAPSVAYTTIASEADYAKTALCFQLDAASNSFVSFSSDAYTCATIPSANISLTNNVNLTNTGFIDLTRDNDIGTVVEGKRTYNGDKCTYSAIFNGKTTATLQNAETHEDESVETIHSITFGGESVYRHAYNGLFGITNNATISDTVFEGTISVNAQEAMYLGSAAATAKGTFNASGLTINTTLSHAGASDLYVGGVLGEASSAIGDITVSDIDADATILGNASSTKLCLGGVIGKISHDTITSEVTWSFSNVAISGGISNTTSLAVNRVGGLVAAISGGDGKTSRTLDLNNISVNDLAINVSANSNGAVGGVLGYSWLSVNTDFDNVQIGKVETTTGTNPVTTITSPSITQTNNAATGVDFAGLVYNGTGHWTLTGADDVKINALQLNSDAADSFGMIVNKGWTGDTSVDSALYLDIQTASAYSITAANVTLKKRTLAQGASELTDMTIPTFDELVAYTAYYTGSGAAKVGYDANADDLYITRNGQAVVSIETGSANGGLNMGTSGESGTYTPATAFGKRSNPYSRYYYNLHTLKTATSGANGLMSWGAKWYAHSSIENDVSSNNWESTIPTGTYNMQGYSWYPVNIDSANVKIEGATTFKLWNKEFEARENYNTDGHAKRTSLYDGGTTQHFLMQSALFYNVNGSLNVENATLQGSVPLIDTRTYETKTVNGVETTTQIGGDLYSGALVLGTVKGSGATEAGTAKVIITKAVLDGVYVHNFNVSTGDYAPLLIDRTANYSTLSINGISVYADTSYKSNPDVQKLTVGTGESAVSYPKVATSLIGNAGVDENSKNINVNFTNIQLDGRNADIVPVLDSVYHSEVSIFTKATLLNKLTFDTGKGTYTFNQSDDWGAISESNTNPKHFVTYGKELGYTDAAAYANTQYPNLERWYLDTNPDTYVNPTSFSDGTGEYAATFVSSYLPYVAYEYHKTNHPEWYQLEVNHSSPEFSGCGTYNDPYLLTSGTDFNTIYSILNTSDDGNPGNVTICIPKSSASAVGLATTWHNSSYGHTSYTYLAADSEDSTNHPAGYYANGVYVNKTDTNNYLTPEKVRIYVAGAYFKLKPANDSDGNPSNIITISSGTFKGLGDTTDSKAQFRGVIVGTGNETIINKSGYPLIAKSNGSVVKDINIIVDMNTAAANATAVTGTITRDMGSAAVYEDDNSKNYGAVMGAVFGGDNIIDGVTVTFQNTRISLSGNAAQLIPVGGYVGVVLNGGVIFRGMVDKRSDSSISGIPTDVVTADTTNGEMTAETNKRWLYVNPIIGRVINGYAVTEASAYRPYEDGTRVYHGGARTLDDGTEDTTGLVTKYWDETNQTEVSTKPATLSHVTMRNGNKHYSIADIDIYADKLDFGPTSDTNATKVKTKPLVPNGQAFFLMSVMVNSGMAKNGLGYNQVYQVSRWAQYDDVGPNASNADGSDWKTYAQLDRVDSTNGTESKRTAKQSSGYLANFYTESAELTKDMANQTTTLTLSTENEKYYLPDGYKGLGNIIQNTDATRMKIATFNGNNATISQNTSYYYYFKKNTNDYQNTLFDTVYTPSSNVGLGLINFQSVNITADSLVLTGNVVADAIDCSSSTGDHIPYYSKNQNYTADPTNNVDGVEKNQMQSVGSFIGKTASVLNLTDIILDNVYVKGLRCTGGLIGYSTDKKVTIDVNKDCDKIKVHSASNAGGLIGRKFAGAANINFNNNHLNLTEVICESIGIEHTNDDTNFAVGGLIGGARCDYDTTTNTDKIYVFENINIGDKDKTDPITIKCEKSSVFTGGLVGVVTRSSLKMDNCHIYNLDITSAYYAGGLVGQIATVPNTRNNNKDYLIETYITNCSIEKNAGSSYGKVVSTGKASGGFIGAGKNDLKKDVILTNCYIKGITLSSSLYTGGVAGVWGYVQNDNPQNDCSCLVLKNFSISDCTLKGNDSVGGLVGVLNEQHQVAGYNNNGTPSKISDRAQYLKGYNVLAKNLKFEPYSESTITYKGYICGLNEKVIQIAGFSRQDNQTEPTMIADLVGKTGTIAWSKPNNVLTETLTENTTNIFGERTYSNVTSTGYVIFADYNDNATNAPNSLLSNVASSGNNVATMRSKTTVTVETYVGGVKTKSEQTITYGDYKTSGLGVSTTYSEGYTEGDTDYTKTTTVVENENYPYVTSSKKTMIDGTNYLTGDGLSSTVFGSSNFSKIVADTGATGADAVNKSYQIYGRYDVDEKKLTSDSLTTDDLSYISARYSSAHSIYSDVTGMRNFPILVVDDTDTAKTTAMLNNYINVLANTNYNYAKPESTVYNVSLRKCTWDEDDNVWSVDTGDASANLFTTTDGKGGYFFSFNPDHVDTGTDPAFSLIDVQYFDPSDTSDSKKIAYHLYIPVYVDQLLRFKFTAALASSTDYYAEPYSENILYLFENLGNPVTMKFEYEYLRTPSVWAQTVNQGGNVLSNYYKSLYLTNTNCFPTGTKLVLVDANNKDKYYYLDTMPTGHYLNLYDFVGEDGTTHYTPAPLQSLMSFVAEVDNTNGNLVQIPETDAANATIKIGSDYYRLAVSGDTGDKYKVYANVAVSQKNDGSLTPVTTSDAKFSSATIKYNGIYYRPIEANEEITENLRYTSEDFKNEKYYLSFFTTAYKTTDKYDIEIRSADSFADKLESSGTTIWEVKNWRPNEIQTNGNTSVHVFLGDLYENQLYLSVVPMKQTGNTQLMSEDNYFLTVTMTACVSLKGNTAQQEETASNMRGTNRTNSPIYQTFLMAYNKNDTDGTQVIGIDRTADGSIMTADGYYKIVSGAYDGDQMATLIDANDSSVRDVTSAEYYNSSESFIELRNNTTLIDRLASSATGYAATLQVKYDMFYDSSLLSHQFPPNQDLENNTNIGAKVIGYSKVSTSKTGVAYSSTSKDVTDSTLYYTADEEKASLEYNVKQTPLETDVSTPYVGDYGGDYSYAGINALEADSDDAVSRIDTVAVYDIRKVQKPGDYVEFTISMSDKDDYLHPAVGDPQPEGHGTARDITQYMSELIVYGSNNTELYKMITDAKSNKATETVDGCLNEDGTMITIRVPRSALKTRGGATSGIYEIPISYQVRTGNTRFKSGTGGLKYSNYRVSLTAATYAAADTATANYTASSYADSYVIYTNARLDSTVR